MRSTYTYFIIIFILINCLQSQSQVYVNVCVTQAPPLQANAGNDIVSCAAGALIGGTPTAIGGTPGYTYSWSSSLLLSSPSVSNPFASPADTTIYTVTINDLLGCSATSSVTFFLNSPPTVSAGINDTIESGGSSQLQASGSQNYLWSPLDGLSCTNCSDPVAAPTIETTYYVLGTDANGCSSADTVKIYVFNDETLYIPNSFSPNANGINDLFFALGSSVKNIDLQIYDRWGELIFRTNDINKGWDGKYKHKNVEAGVYVYYVECEWQSGTPTYRRGIITLLR